MDQQSVEAFVGMLTKWRPTMFRAYPAALAIVAKYIEDHSITEIRPRLVEVTAEKATPPQRELMERAFNAPVADHYSSWEIPDMAYECPSHGLHVMEDRYLELVAKDRVVQTGNLGEVVVTSLTQYAMPFIRFKNGDVGVYAPGNCPCGRSMPALREIVGRSSDMLSKPDGSIVHWSSFYTIVRFRPEFSECQLYQPDRNHLMVRLVPKQDVAPEVLSSIRDELQPCFGDSMQISIQLVPEIPLAPSGKRRLTISEVKPAFL
jgi:phenylacetate-CoA ligase